MAMQPKKKVAKKAPAKKKIPALMRPIVVIPEEEDDILAGGYFGGDVMLDTFEKEVERISKQLENDGTYGRDEQVCVYEVKVLRKAVIRRNKVSVETETF